MIRVTNFHKAYRAVTAVRRLDFELGAGQILGLVGPNGAGKTTTLRVLSGVIPPTGGRLEVAGHDIVRDAVAAKTRLAYVPDDPKLFDTLTVAEYLDFIASAYDVSGARDKGARICSTPSGHLRQNRFYSCAMDDGHAQNALRCVESNAVRAGLVKGAWECPWSSAAAHCGPLFLALYRTTLSRLPL